MRVYRPILNNRNGGGGVGGWEEIQSCTDLGQVAHAGHKSRDLITQQLHHCEQGFSKNQKTKRRSIILRLRKLSFQCSWKVLL